jgi:hypothetical protein
MTLWSTKPQTGMSARDLLPCGIHQHASGVCRNSKSTSHFSLPSYYTVSGRSQPESSNWHAAILVTLLRRFLCVQTKLEVWILRRCGRSAAVGPVPRRPFSRSVGQSMYEERFSATPTKGGNNRKKWPEHLTPDFDVKQIVSCNPFKS